jgi:hypothetical protein
MTWASDQKEAGAVDRLEQPEDDQESRVEDDPLTEDEHFDARVGVLMNGVRRNVEEEDVETEA